MSTGARKSSGSKSVSKEPDDSICPTCRGTTYVGETISCETCRFWFHFECVGVSHQDECVKSEDVPFFCPTCNGSTPARDKASKRKAKKKEKDIPAVRGAASPLKSPPAKLKVPSRRDKNVVAGGQAAPPCPATDVPAAQASRRRLGSEDEEDKWLSAVESGNVQSLDDEMKKIRDPKLMTARQRALVIKKKSESVSFSPQASSPRSSIAESPSCSLMISTPVSLDGHGHVSLDFGSSSRKKPVSEESIIEQKAIKSQKRREMELERRELDKQKTMDRLLKKKESKVAKLLKSTQTRLPEQEGGVWSYRQTLQGWSLSLPAHQEYPLPATKASRPPPQPVKCSVAGCQNSKRYSCSRTGRPLCSLSCYKKNLLPSPACLSVAS